MIFILWSGVFDEKSDRDVLWDRAVNRIRLLWVLTTPLDIDALTSEQAKRRFPLGVSAVISKDSSNAWTWYDKNNTVSARAVGVTLVPNDASSSAFWHSFRCVTTSSEATVRNKDMRLVSDNESVPI